MRADVVKLKSLSVTTIDYSNISTHGKRAQPKLATYKRMIMQEWVGRICSEKLYTFGVLTVEFAIIPDTFLVGFQKA